MKAAWNRIAEALGREEDGTSLALFRIGVGLTVFGELILTWLRGASTALWHAGPAGGIRASLAGHHWVWAWLDPNRAAHVDAVFWATTAAAALVAAGLGTRIAAPVALFGLQALFDLSAGSGGGHDRMFTISLFVLTFARSEVTLSLASRLRTGAWVGAAPATVWPRVLLGWNLALIYVSAGVVKLAAEWLPSGDFRAVYNVLLTAHWARADWAWLVGPLFPLTQVGTALTVLWESTWFAVPLWLVARRGSGRWARRVARLPVRAVYLGIGVVLHGLLWAMANLGPFSPITLTWYAILFAPEEWKGAWHRIAAARGAR